MPKIVAIYASPRKKGNTSRLLGEAVEAARKAGAEVAEFHLRDLKMSPCLEIYGCKNAGRCVINDDFHALSDAIFQSDGMMFASPIFFYAVSAHAKIFMDRCQSLWVKKYWIEKKSPAEKIFTRKGLFVSAGATSGKKLFDGALLSMRYLFDVFDMELSGSLLVRGLEFEGDADRHPEYLEEARKAGAGFAESLETTGSRLNL